MSNSINYYLSKWEYFRMFLFVFLIEVIVEVFGYQLAGRWVYEIIFHLDMRWEGLVHVVWMLIISTPILYGWLISQLDRQRELMMELSDKENEFLSLFSHNSDTVIAYSAKGKLVHMNPAAERMLGYTALQMLKMDCQTVDKILGRSRSSLYSEKALKGETQEYENSMTCKDGRTIQVMEKVVPIYRGQTVTGVYILAKDVTLQREAEQRIWKLAHHDHLTQLPNRRRFSDLLNQSLEDAQKGISKPAVLFVDLDRFKYINDALGHDVGDEVLKIVSQRMSDVVREGDIVARFGGDEFAVLIPNVDHIDEAKEVAERILEVVQQIIAFEGYEFHLTSSIGIAAYPISGEKSTDLLKNVDTAMYEAKRQGKNRYQIHMFSMHERAYERFRLEKDLRWALSHEEELFLEYQPQVDVKDGKVHSMEALVRWQHPMLGLISPAEFIPLAEDSGLIIPLGQYVLKRACRQIQEWNRNKMEPMAIGINVSPVELNQDDFIRNFRMILDEMGVAPQYIAIEITESTMMKNERNTLEKIKELKDMGIKIFVDDFGRGYSSLGFLKQFPVDVLKVDEIFVRELDSNYEDASIVSAVITLAHSRSMKVIAEGVEREKQLEVLRLHACDEYQGYLFSPPISPESFGEKHLIVR